MAEEVTLEREWLQFRLLDIATNAPDVQIREMRKAFFAGAGSALAICSVPMNGRTRHLTHIALLAEIERYLADFKATSQQGKP